MDLKAYITPLIRWWWLIVAASLVAGIASFLATLRQPPIYQAKTTLIVGKSIDNPNPNQGDLYLSQQLANNYADLASREPVQNATKQALGLSRLPDYLARAVPNAQLIEIAVTDTSPIRAQAVANELANQLILRSPSARPEEQARQNFINQQLDLMQTQIVDTQNEITKLKEQLGSLNSASQIADMQTQISALQSKLSTLDANYAALLANTQKGATNTLAVVTPADLPVYPIGPQKVLSILLSSAIGFVLAVGAAYLLEYLDDTIKTPDDVSRTLHFPVIGFISDMVDADERGIFVSKNPISPISEAFRSLRGNIEFASAESPVKTLLLTGFYPSMGKTTVTTNLAITMAQGDYKVVLVDGDLYKPNIHNVMGIDNSSGLSEVLSGKIKIDQAKQKWNENLSVITGGEGSLNPVDILGSKKIDHLLTDLSKDAMVIIDGPPILLSEASALASKVDGVLLVIRPDQVRKSSAKAIMQQVNRTKARVLGVVLNRIPHRKTEYYGGFDYYSPYYAKGYGMSGKKSSGQAESLGRVAWYESLLKRIKRSADVSDD